MPIWNIPIARNPFFTGREDLLEQLHTQLNRNQTALLSQPQTISGLGGIGKTQLAVEYAYRYGHEYEYVLWAHAENNETLNSSYTELAHLLALPMKDVREQEKVIRAVKRWLQQQRGWLLILDNADHPVILPAFLPPTVGGHLLITTRTAEVDAQIAGFAHPLVVKTFADEQGALFLLRRANLLAPDTILDQAEADTRQRAVEIAHELGGLPLALDQAGAYLKTTGCNLAAYQQLYQQHRAQLLTERRGGDHPEPVAATWNISFRDVEQQNPSAGNLLRLCAFLAPDAIPEAILTEGAEELGPVLAPVVTNAYLLNEAIECLRIYSLIDRDPHTQTLIVHRLVQAVVRDKLPAHTHIRWMQSAIRAVVATFPEMEFANWPFLERLLPHALACATWIQQTTLAIPEAFNLLNLTGDYLLERGRFKEAESLLLSALQLGEHLFGPQDLNLVQSLNALADLYKEKAEYPQAESLLKRALEICEQILGSSHLEVALSLDHLADLRFDQWIRVRQPELQKSPFYNLIHLKQLEWEYYEIEAPYVRALEIREQLLGPGHLKVVHSLNRLAKLYTNQGEYYASYKYREAEALCQRALSICKEAADPEYLIGSLKTLANFYSDSEIGNYKKAIPLLQQVVALREQTSQPEPLLIADALEDLALCLFKWSKYKKSAPLFERVLTIRKLTLGNNDPDVAFCLHNLGCCYASQKQYERAEPFFQGALKIWNKALGPEHHNTIQAQKNNDALKQKMRR